ncbi:MAG: multidrug/spermidine efflux SMR transporter subunit MdtI [Candidimonas sp.]|jgi:spermidine export protein MdtI
MYNAAFAHYTFMGAAILLEVAANIFIKASHGFSNRLAGALGIGCILASFTALSQAVKGIDLSIAYALWGGAGILLSAAAGLMLFRQRLNGKGWLGIAWIVMGISLLKLA